MLNTTFANEYEQFIISGYREESLSTLVPGSEPDEFLKILRKINSESIPEGDEFKNYAAADRLNLLLNLKSYDVPDTPSSEKTNILNELRDMYMPESFGEYPKPSHYNLNQMQLFEEATFNSKLEENLFDLKEVLSRLYRPDATVQEIENIIMNDLNNQSVPILLDFTKFSDKILLELVLNSSSLGDLLRSIMFRQKNEVIQKIVKLVNTPDLKSNTQAINYLNTLHENMTTQQIEYYLGVLSDNYNKDELYKELINRKFKLNLKSSETDLVEKRKILLEIYDYLKDKPLTFNSMRCDIILLILENGKAINKYDKQLFKEYLENPIFTDQYNLKDEKIEKIKFWNRYRQVICEMAVKSNREENDIIIAYLFHFFMFEKCSIEEFSPYFKKDYLYREYNKAFVYRGEDDTNYTNIINQMDPIDYEKIVNEVKISICEFNKERFNIDEPVVLQIDTKNVQTLFIKIFEINTENYYYDKREPISSAITLEGLVATYEETYCFSDKRQKLLRRNFELEKIPNRKGFYIVEIMGNGLSSRAIIKKGVLTLVSRSTVNGKILYILNENQNVCKGATTGVWVKEEFYKSDINSGAILIPYQRSNSSEKVILIHEGFAELAIISLETENYELNASFLLNNESIIMGNVAKVLIRPFLFVNKRIANLNNLKNPKITINLTKSENDQVIPINTTFEGETYKNKLIDNQEIQVEFQVPPRLTNIKITFQAEVKNYTEDTLKTLNVSKDFPVDSYNYNIYAKFFLKRSQSGEYILDLLGKNGEPKPMVQVTLILDHDYKTFKIPINLQTNNFGSINLGKLPNVSKFSVRSNYRGNNINAAFDLDNQNLIHYPNELDIIEGEEITLPTAADFDEKHLFFWRYENEEKILENCRSNVKVNSYDDNHKFILINNLTEGSYKLSIFKKMKEIKIKVHKGRYWDDKYFIITKNGIIENTEEKQIAHLEKLHYDSSSNTLSIKVNANDSANVHLFAYNYHNNLELTNGNSIKNILSNSLFNMVYSVDKWKNIYLSNRVLNEEVQYVFDRKQYSRFMGNSLEKPGLLLKRQFVRDTKTDIQEVKEGTQYNDIRSEMVKERLRGDGSMKKMAFKDDMYGHPMMSSNSYSMPISAQNSISTFQNFIPNAPLILTNLKANENGEIILNLDLKEYTILNALVIDKSTVYEENLILTNSENEGTKKFRDLTMSNPLDPKKSFSELRKTVTLLKDSKFTINDITSTSFQIIDSLEKYVSFLSLTNYFSPVTSDWNNLNFLLKFDELSANDKLKKLSEYFCHEVNIFLFFRHNKFFNENVKPVLRFKSEKSFVDFFLLGDIVRLKEFCSASRINNLNVFEQCLLIYAFRNIDKEFVKSIATNIRNKAEAAQNKISPQELKRLFNIIMNMKTEEAETLTVFAATTLEDQAFAFDFSEKAFDFSEKDRMRPKMMRMACAAPMMKKKMSVRKEAYAMFDDVLPENEIIIANLRNNLNKEPGKSKEYCETHYYNNKNKANNVNRELIAVNLFYADLADFWVKNIDSELNINFISSNIILPVGSIPQLITTLSVLDLPSSSNSHKTTRTEGLGLEIIPKTNMIIFTKEISETSADIKTNIMIAQIVNKKEYNYDDPNNNLDEENEQTNLYLSNQIYKHETIVTNISNKTLTFELLIQIPEGAIPVDSSEYTKTVNLKLEKFNTNKYDTFFYFPKQGKFIQFPPNASIDGIVVAKSKPIIYDVRDSILKMTHSTLDDVLESGSKTEILEFLNKIESLDRKDIYKVFWLLKDGEFYAELIKLLRSRGMYDEVVWSYGYHHNDIQAISEYLSRNYLVKSIIGPCANFSLCHIDNTSNFDVMNHKDYHPILNSRVHRLSNNNLKNNAILNKEFKQTYQNFINYLIGLKTIDSKNLIRLCYYLILQDRIEEALKVFERIKIEEADDLVLQYDYITAYLDFSTNYPQFTLARKICEKYRNFPLNNWKEMFEEIEDQLLEFDGKQSYDDIDSLVNEDKKKKQNSKIAAQSEPQLQFSIENKSLHIIYNNINKIFVKFYLIDLEILFSRTPFIKQNSDDFSFVQPNFIDILTLDMATKEKSLDYQIPENLRHSNLFIEVSSTTKKCFDTFFSTSLNVNISEIMGEVKAIDENLSPLTKVYVKCFAKYNDESVKFYKDGYTDLRGRFNYVSLNTNKLKDIKKFSLFISHDTHGSTIKECNPPSNIDSFINSTDNIGATEYDNYQNYRQELKKMNKIKK